MSDHDDPEYSIGAIPAAIFTGGLDLDQEIELQTINECIVRGQEYVKRLADGDEELRHHFEPLRRILLAISDGAIVPILQRINEHGDPPRAFKETIAGIGGLMFFGGVEYAKINGLNGVEGNPKPRVKAGRKETDSTVHPEQMPVGGNSDLRAYLKDLGMEDDE